MIARCVLVACVLLGILSACPPTKVGAADRPNIILIMADDLGAEGLACYNSAIYTTPNLDALASEGALFENAYATPLCTPTRVMIMSGQYANRTGFLSLISKRVEDRLPKELKTIGNYFEENGYLTAIAGKWQLGQFDHIPDQMAEHGFQHSCMWKWMWDGKKTSRYYSPAIWQDGASKDGDEKIFGPDVYNSYLLSFIENSRDLPFFVYFPMALTHSPFIGPPSLEELAHSRYHDGMDKDTKNFGHMITYMDMLIGKIVEKVRETGKAENTLIVFTADNGCNHGIVSRLGDMDLKGGKGSMTESGTRVPLICYWPGTIPPGRREQFFSLADMLPTLGAIAGIEIGEVDGMDLSHNLLGTEGQDRDHIFIAYKKEALIRDKRFRLNEKGELFNIPVTSDETRYSEKRSKNPEHLPRKEEMQELLDGYLAIQRMELGRN